MPALSAFQRLPLHVAEAVIKYYVLPFQVYSEKEWLVLYDISYSWRTLALQRFYQNALIIASAAAKEDELEFPDKPSHIEVNTALFSCVKGVEIFFDDESEGTTGEGQPNDFSNTWPETLVFPTARSLRVNVTGFLKYYAKMNGMLASTEFMWLVQRIRTAMPTLQNATILDDSHRRVFDRDSLSGYHWNADNLLSAILERVTNVYISARALCPKDIRPSVHSFSGLVQLEFNCGRNVELLHNIVKGSATTLETLHIRTYPLKTIESLIVDDEGQLVVFHRLHKLYFESFANHRRSYIGVRIDKSAVVFPALRHLTWASVYMFEDDVLFRGNSSTLEYLVVDFSSDLVNVLETHNVFSAGKYPRLGHVEVREHRDDIHSSPNRDLYLKHMARLLSPATQFLSISDKFSYQEINGAVFESSSLQNIRVLNVSRIEIKFFEMLDFVKRLPNLTRLRTSPFSMYPELEHGISRIEAFVEGVYKKYYPLHFRFKLWKLASRESRFTSLVALASVVLAAVCPSFAYTEVPYNSRDSYIYNLNAAISKMSHGQHSETLERLYKRSVEYLSE